MAVTDTDKLDPHSALRTAQAAEFLGCTAAHLTNLRTFDKRAMKLGEPTKGPRFCILGHNITVYLRKDLIAWLESHYVTPENVVMRHERKPATAAKRNTSRAKSRSAALLA